MTDTYVEVPLDPEYITPDGAYIAGYIWGQHVRMEKDARQMFPGDTDLHDNFYKGVADGYNDKLNEIRPLRPPSKSDVDVSLDGLTKMYHEGQLSTKEFAEGIHQVFRMVEKGDIIKL